MLSYGRLHHGGLSCWRLSYRRFPYRRLSHGRLSLGAICLSGWNAGNRTFCTIHSLPVCKYRFPHKHTDVKHPNKLEYQRISIHFMR